MLTVIAGPMFSGKTSKLISMIESNLIANNRVAVFKPSNDDRYSTEKIVTHSGKGVDATMISRSRPCIEYFVPSVLFFDECQFFDTEQFIRLIDRTLKHNADVVCAGLPNDFEGKPFGPMPMLLAMADEIVSLKAVCAKCKKINSATRTFRKTDSKEQTVVGGADIYEPRCFNCWT